MSAVLAARKLEQSQVGDSNLIERCAFAILADYEQQVSSGELVHESNGDVRLNASALVRAVLREMREPLDPRGRIVSLGVAALLQYPDLVQFEPRTEQIASEVFKAMIDAALTEG